MDKIMPCGLDDSRLLDQADANEAARQERVETYADNLKSECKNYIRVVELLVRYEMLEECAQIIAAIANWSGRSADSADLAMKVDLILTGGLYEIAEQEVK